MSSPLEIPELKLLIFQHLDDLDCRRACALVSKSWHNEVQPLVWETFVAQRPKATRRRIPDGYPEDRMKSIRKNAHFIKRLTRLGNRDVPLSVLELTTIFVERCRSLVSFNAGAINKQDWEACKELVALNPKLQNVELSSHDNPGKYLMDQSFYTSVKGFAHLRQLAMGCRTSSMSLALIMDNCPMLEVLNVGGDVLPFNFDLRGMVGAASDDDGYDWNPQVVAQDKDQQQVEARSATVGGDRKQDKKGDNGEGPEKKVNLKLPWGLARLSGLKKIHLEQRCHDPNFPTVLKLCPSLDTLILNDTSNEVRDEICGIIRRNYFSMLTSLALGSGDMDRHLHKAYLNALPPHQIKNLHFQGIEAEDIKLLVDRQHKSLEDMHLQIDVDGKMSIVHILARCNRLKELTIEMFHRDVIDVRFVIGVPWVCSEMKALQIPFGLDQRCRDVILLMQAEEEKEGLWPGRAEWEQAEMMFMKRLGQLTKMQTLDMQQGDAISTLDMFRRCDGALTWTLENGLGSLKDFTSLEYFAPGHSEHSSLGLAEFQFMKEHWPRLDKINCYTSHETRGWLRDHWPELKVSRSEYYDDEFD